MDNNRFSILVSGTEIGGIHTRPSNLQGVQLGLAASLHHYAYWTDPHVTEGTSKYIMVFVDVYLPESNLMIPKQELTLLHTNYLQYHLTPPISTDSISTDGMLHQNGSKTSQSGTKFPKYSTYVELQMVSTSCKPSMRIYIW